MRVNVLLIIRGRRGRGRGVRYVVQSRAKRASTDRKAPWRPAEDVEIARSVQNVVDSVRRVLDDVSKCAMQPIFDADFVQNGSFGVGQLRQSVAHCLGMVWFGQQGVLATAPGLASFPRHGEVHGIAVIDVGIVSVGLLHVESIEASRCVGAEEARREGDNARLRVVFVG